MRTLYPQLALAKLCGWFGITRQAYYQNSWAASEASIQEELIIHQVLGYKKEHPQMGGRKIHQLMQGFMEEHQIRMGRDAFFNLLSANKLLVRRRKRKIQTTNSYHWMRKYPNLIKNFVPKAPNELWVSDITYWRINNGKHLYISLITDAFSHKIVGFQAADNLEAVESIEALKMALGELALSEHKLIHHSDRGAQYCSLNYVDILKRENIGISMTENGDPYENAVAERVNGILKEEYLHHYQVNNLTQAREKLKEAVMLYNDKRPHNSIANLTPNQVHTNKILTQKLWKNRRRTKPVNDASVGNSFSPLPDIGTQESTNLTKEV